jgi:hypothetical protein
MAAAAGLESWCAAAAARIGTRAVTEFVSTPLFIALVGIAGAVLGAVVNGALATRAKINEEMRQLRLNSYPLLWQLTSHFSRWPRMTNTYSDLEKFHGSFRSWYYDTGGLHLSENSRARYGEVQELMATNLGALEGQPMPAQPSDPIPDLVYSGLLDACSALRTALTEDLESRKQRSILHRIGLAARHRKQKAKAAERLAEAKRDRSQRGNAPAASSG